MRGPIRMKLSFLGTRGNIEARTRRHYRHSSLLVSYRGKEIIIDWGADWLRKSDEVSACAMVLTHAHPDHAGGLKNGAPCTVYATEDTWQGIASYPLGAREVIKQRKAIEIHGVIFEAFPVEHSLRAPAVGYRISAGSARIFYGPDLVYIRDRREALSGIGLYVGDGATIARPIVRRRNEVLIGHAAIQTQLTWCREEGVPRAIFTHCGSQIVSGDERSLGAMVRALGRDRSVDARIAYDGMEVIVRGGGVRPH